MNLNKTYILLIFLVITGKLYSQTNSIGGRNYSEKIPEKYKLNVSALREHVNNIIPASYKTNNQFNRMAYEFSDAQAIYVSDFISSGKIYSDWDEFEDYVNEILQKIMPDELKNDKVIHAYIVKDGDYNAFMSGTGHMFIHTGIFTYIDDEASLAAIMAHELAHYYKQHSFLTFFEAETYWKYDLGGFADFSREARQFSIKHEQQADSLAMVWLGRSEFHRSGIVQSLHIIERLEKQQLKQYETLWKLKANTHPLSEERINSLYEYYNTKMNDSGEVFLVSKEKFMKFKEDVKIENLKSFLFNFKYQKCIETAFRYHLFDPDNQVYIYYLLEAIRRNCYLYPDDWNENFITCRYFKDVSTPNEKLKEKVKDDIFANFDLEMLGMNAKDAQKIVAKFYWQGEQRKFKTYENAFEYYYQVSKLLKCKECVFTNALSQTNKIYRDSLLHEYLSFDSIVYRNLAEDLLNENVIKNLPAKKLLVFNNFLASVYQGQDEIQIRSQSENDAVELIGLFDSIALHFSDRIPLYMLSVKEKQLSDYMMLRELYDFSNNYILSSGKETMLHLLDPRYIQLFYQYKVNEIEFLNFRYEESRKAENSVDAYKDVVNMTYHDIFTRIKETRALSVYISSVREIENSVMKIKYGGNSKLKFNKPGFGEIVSELRSHIITKDERVSNQYYKYQK